MGAVEHLKTLCCLGLPPESAMIAVTPLLHEIIPHGWSRYSLFNSDGSITGGYVENPEAGPHARERFAEFMDDPTGIASLMIPAFHAVGIGWTLHRQGRSWLESAYYREVEAPIDSCWILDAMIADAGRTIVGINLTRPRSARLFTADDVQRLDRLRPWLAHALRRHPSGDAHPKDEEPLGRAGAPVASGQMVLTSDAKLVFQTRGLEFLLGTFKPGNYTRYVPVSDRLPAPVLKLFRQINLPWVRRNPRSRTNLASDSPLSRISRKGSIRLSMFTIPPG